MKIACFVLIYQEYDIIKASLESLTQLSDRLEINVIENFSDQTEARIKPFALGLLEARKIRRYYLFAENISNNAFEVVCGNFDLGGYDYVLLTDGDLTVEPSFLAEELRILSRPGVFAVGVDLARDNLPTATFPEAGAWVPEGIPRDSYVEGLTGLWMLLLRAADFTAWRQHRRANNLKFVDGALHDYCGATGRVWARTVGHRARHLTWDLYQDADHPYTRLKKEKSFEQHWYHQRFCSYQVWERPPAPGVAQRLAAHARALARQVARGIK